MEWGEEAAVDDPLAQRLLNSIDHDPDGRRVYKESLTDWILDTQPRTAPVGAAALVQYLAAHQPERLQITVRLQAELARALESLDRH
jgi:hypothetical protein